MKPAELISMTRMETIYTWSDTPTKRGARRTVVKARQFMSSTGRSAAQAVAMVGLMAAATSSLSSATTLSVARTEAEGHSVSWTLMDLSNITLDEFVDKNLTLRDELALRAIDNKLSPIEAAQLHVLNSTLKRLLPQPEPLPREVVDAMAEVHRLLGA